MLCWLLLLMYIVWVCECVTGIGEIQISLLFLLLKSNINILEFLQIFSNKSQNRITIFRAHTVTNQKIYQNYNCSALNTLLKRFKRTNEVSNCRFALYFRLNRLEYVKKTYSYILRTSSASIAQSKRLITFSPLWGHSTVDPSSNAGHAVNNQRRFGFLEEHLPHRVRSCMQDTHRQAASRTLEHYALRRQGVVVIRRQRNRERIPPMEY